MSDTHSEQIDRLRGKLLVDTRLAGTLHVHVAYDWADEILLDKAERELQSERYPLARRRRTPSSFGYRTPPLRFHLPEVRLELPELGAVSAAAEVTVFDFGGASVSLHVPFQLVPAALTRLAGNLASSEGVLAAARAAAAPIFEKLRPFMADAIWSPLSEEYFVFHLEPGAPLPSPEVLIHEHGSWLASLLRLEVAPLSTTEVAQSLEARIDYTPDDLFLAEWSAALLIDRDCDETLQAIEFANLQLLEFRYLDDRLDSRLAAAYRLVHPLERSWLPFWRTYARPLRDLGELRIEANDVFDRTTNVLKLVGDQYLARLYHLLAARFHLAEWETSIQRSMDTVEGVYQTVSDQATTYRVELLEWIIIALIAFEVVMSLAGG